ncbi:hypothetical protein [Leadbettera azotonutricia]|uniref:Uncharacterized protein n=1 Tax=Leadbettera azotonutricia (strain ATCC BAA-888 / DSM 13862 / ZAS-9) TaxID=545695 RepID=F5YD78_LEAAZ|nr:hypothetical protein [Leadbettera azotonutricia]AEF82051.1 conserved hypothetical protein [Leadbettera azotonutricia ZAS-9]
MNNASLLRLIPPVLRARDYHLYPGTSTRLVDLWLDGGKALLGHKPPKVLGELKNSAERGLFSPLPHPQEKHFIKALSRLFPNRSFRAYADGSSLNRALSHAAQDVAPLFTWRPFMGNTETLSAYPLIFPVLPWPLAPLALVLDKELEPQFPEGDIIPPAILAATTRAVHNLLASPERGSPKYPKIEKALKTPRHPWKREGIYLSYGDTIDMNFWEALWKQFLEAGFLLPPTPDDPLILPGTLSQGEETKLAALL